MKCSLKRIAKGKLGAGRGGGKVAKTFGVKAAGQKTRMVQSPSDEWCEGGGRQGTPGETLEYRDVPRMYSQNFIVYFI